MDCLRLLLAYLAFGFGITASAQEPTIDGKFEDWSSVTELASDPPGDAKGAFDIRSVAGVSAGNVLYLKLTLQHPLNLQNGPGNDGLFPMMLKVGDKYLDIDFRSKRVTDGSKYHIGWEKVGFQCLPTHSSHQFEMRIDLSAIGVKPGDDVSIQFRVSDSLDQPAKVRLRPAQNKMPKFYDWSKWP